MQKWQNNRYERMAARLMPQMLGRSPATGEPALLALTTGMLEDGRGNPDPHPQYDQPSPQTWDRWLALLAREPDQAMSAMLQVLGREQIDSLPPERDELKQTLNFLMVEALDSLNLLA